MTNFNKKENETILTDPLKHYNIDLYDSTHSYYNNNLMKCYVDKFEFEYLIVERIMQRYPDDIDLLYNNPRVSYITVALESHSYSIFLNQYRKVLPKHYNDIVKELKGEMSIDELKNLYDKRPNEYTLDDPKDSIYGDIDENTALKKDGYTTLTDPLNDTGFGPDHYRSLYVVYIDKYESSYMIVNRILGREVGTLRKMYEDNPNLIVPRKFEEYYLLMKEYKKYYPEDFKKLTKELQGTLDIDTLWKWCPLHPDTPGEHIDFQARIFEQQIKPFEKKIWGFTGDLFPIFPEAVGPKAKLSQYKPIDITLFDSEEEKALIEKVNKILKDEEFIKSADNSIHRLNIIRTLNGCDYEEFIRKYKKYRKLYLGDKDEDDTTLSSPVKDKDKDETTLFSPAKEQGNSSDNNCSSCIDNKCGKLLDRYMRLYGKKSSVKGNENEEISFFYDLENNTGFTNIFSFSCIPEFFLFSCLFFFLSYGILMKLSKQKKFPLLEKHNIFLICIILFFFIFLNLNYYIEDFFLYNSYFVHTKSSTIISCLISFFSIFTCLIMYNYVLKENIDNIEYYIILLSSIFSLCLLLQCNEVISFFFLLELQSICFYILSAFNRRYKLTIQSGIKYFIIGGVSSIFIIIGFTFFYYFTGSTSFEDFRMFFFRPSNFSYHEFLFNLGIFFLTIGLFMKLYISPFHWWILDVYEGSPSITTLFFSTVPYICFFFILYKIYFIIFLGNFFYYWFYFLLGSLLSMFIGSIGALLQKRIKRLIGYSSIGVIGYTLTIFLENYNFNYLEGIQLLFVYSICVFILFSFFFNINCVYLKKGFFLFIEYIEDIYLLRKLECNKAGKYLLSLGFYGILGLPPMSLFFQKFNLIKNIGISSNWFISFFFVLSSILSGFYYLYVIKEVFYHSFIYNTYRETMLYSLSFYNTITYLMFIFLFFEFYYLLTGCNFNFFIIH